MGKTLQYSHDELLRDHNVFFPPANGVGNENGSVDATSLQNRVSDLESEVVSLKEQLGKAKGLNDAMWDSVVKNLVEKTGDSQGDPKGIEPKESEDQRKRKRGRS